MKIGFVARLVTLTVLVLAAVTVPLPAAAATTWVVNTAADTSSGCTTDSCSLRSAIGAANAAGGGTINFAIPGTGRPAIIVSSPLPTVTGARTVLDATTQSGGQVPGVELTLDPSVTSAVNGLQISGSNVSIRGFAITSFTNYGIYLTSSSTGDTVAGNWIGTRDGMTPAGNTHDGIHVVGGGGHAIGGTGPGDANVVSGSTAHNGIALVGSSNNVVVGNLVGMTADGLGRLPNENTGIGIFRDSTGNRIGGTTAAERNIVSGNNGIGVQLLGSMQSDGTCLAPANNVVEGNWLGVNANGVKPAPYGNQGEAVEIEVCAHGNLIGGTAPGAGNVISGSLDDGIQVDGIGSPSGSVCDTTIQGNLIGTTASGMSAAPNRDPGVKIQNFACNTLVGGTDQGARNVISGGTSDGVYLKSNPQGTKIINNIIGLAKDGTTPLGNAGYGIRLYQGSRGEVVQGNTVSNNRLSGIYLQDVNTNTNTVSGNSVGTTVDGASGQGNQQYGIYLTDGPSKNVISSNKVTSNAMGGIAVAQPSTNSTIGDTLSQNTVSGNGGLGIDLVPVTGINPQDGTHLDPTVANEGLDFPVITGATSTSVAGSAVPGTTVEVFTTSTTTTSTNGDTAGYLGSVPAGADGSWCLDSVTVSGAVTATATNAGGDTSEYAANVPPSGSGDLCTAPSGTRRVLFSDTYGGADGSKLGTTYDVRKSATGSPTTATIASNQLAESVTLASAQVGSWQYLQTRETVVQPDWSTGMLDVTWAMSTAANAAQSSSLVLGSTTTTGNATSLANYLRVYVSNGKLIVAQRNASGTTTLWTGTETASSTVRDLELRLTASNLTLLEGPAGGPLAVRGGPVAHQLSFTSGWPYLQVSTNAAATYTGLFDNLTLAKVATPPSAPGNVTATPGDGSATVTWTPPTSDGGAPITTYTVTSSGGQSIDVAGATSATIGGLTNGTSYTFTVTATNAAGDGPASAPSNSVTPKAPAQPPGAPTSVDAASSGDGSVVVSWTAPASDGGSAVTSYTVQASDGSRVLVPAGADGSVPTRVTVTGLETGTQYTFTVLATNAVGDGPWSGSSPVVTPQPGLTTPSAPRGVTARAGDGSAQVSWSPPLSDGGSPVTGYEVVSSDGQATSVAAGADGTVPTTATVGGLTNGLSYTFTVSAANAIGMGPSSSPSSAVTPAPAPTPPGTPTSVSATAGDASATVSWTAPTSDGGSPITAYRVTSSGGQTASVTAASGGVVPTTATVSGLTNGTSYTFVVVATNPVGTSPASAPSNTVTPQAAPQLLFRDSFTGADGTAPTNWEIRKSATGAGTAVVISSNALSETVVLDPSQVGSWQFIQAREKVVQPSWSSGTLVTDWQMSTAATSSQTSSLVLTPTATPGNATSTTDYLRVYVSNGRLNLQVKVSGTTTTLWSGTETAGTSLRSFEIRIDASQVTLLEGPVGGSLTVRAGPTPHRLGFTAAYPYLQVSTNAAASFSGLFDEFSLTKLS